ncbi:MAG: hypothetical protein ACOC44_09755 [Promethearchaeia archaeon]
MKETELPHKCIDHYKGKGKHLALTIPLLMLMIAIFFYLNSLNLILGLIYISFYIATNFFQAYCCVYQECPYIGNYCPGIVCLYPASLIAQLSIYQKMKRTKKRFNIFVTLAEISLFSFIIFPLFFFFSLGFLYLVAYIGFILIYTLLFLWFICPDCAIKNTCPAGKSSQKLRMLIEMQLIKEKEKNSFKVFVGND